MKNWVAEWERPGSDVSKDGDLLQPSLYKWVTAHARAQGLRYVQFLKPGHIQHMPYNDINAHLVYSCSTMHMCVHERQQTYIKTYRKRWERERKTPILCDSNSPVHGAWCLDMGRQTWEL